MTAGGNMTADVSITGESVEKVATYDGPPLASQIRFKSVNVTNMDLQRMDHGENLNDAIMDFVTQLAMHLLNKKKDSYCFSSLFYTRLCAEEVKNATKGWANV